MAKWNFPDEEGFVTVFDSTAPKYICWHCQSELIWGSDQDIDDSDDYKMVTFLSCSNCGCDVEYWLPKKGIH